MQNNSSGSKWYYGLVPVFLGLILMGPFAFPLLWKSPQFNLFWKVLLTFLVAAATLWMIKASAGVLGILMAQIKQIKEAGLL